MEKKHKCFVCNAVVELNDKRSKDCAELSLQYAEVAKEYEEKCRCKYKDLNI